MDLGLIGGIVGSIIGLIGGCVGTYCGIKKTRGSRERAFMIRMSVFGWIIAALFVLLVFFLPDPYGLYVLILFLVLLPFGIGFVNHTQQRIRRDESPRDEMKEGA